MNRFKGVVDLTGRSTASADGTLSKREITVYTSRRDGSVVPLRKDRRLICSTLQKTPAGHSRWPIARVEGRHQEEVSAFKFKLNAIRDN